jgi:hypothetical protein
MPETKKCPNFRKPLIFCHTRPHPDTSADAEQRDGVLPIGLLVRHYPHSAITALTESDYMTTQTLTQKSLTWATRFCQFPSGRVI